MAGTNYFSYFPSMRYDNKDVIDIFKRARMVNMGDNLKGYVFYKYTIQEGEKPEHIAERYYGDTRYYWIILYANDILNVTAQWPRSYRDFENYIIGKYGSIEAAAIRSNDIAIHHYEDEDGNWITKDEWTVQGAQEIFRKTNYDYEYDLNENKKEINIPKVEYLKQIINEMNKIFKK